MARMVLEHAGSLDECPSPEEMRSRIFEHAERIGNQARSLASADPPWLVEESVSITISDPPETYRVHAVMNTEKGRRILVRKAE